MSKKQQYNNEIRRGSRSQNKENSYASKHNKRKELPQPMEECSDVVSKDQIIQQQKRHIQSLKLGCPRCISNKNTELELRNKILVQNSQILQLLSQEMPSLDYVNIIEQNKQQQFRIEQLECKLNEAEQINEENRYLRSMLQDNYPNHSSCKEYTQQQYYSTYRNHKGVSLQCISFNRKCYSLKFSRLQMIDRCPLSDQYMIVNKVICFGAGYVGGPTMAMMASKCPDTQFYVYDISAEQIHRWNTLDFPVYEKHLQEYISKTINKNLFFTNDLELALTDCDVAFLAVNTPSKQHGLGAPNSLDISYVDSCIRLIQKFKLTKPLIVVEKSTVPVKTSDYIKAVLKSQDIQVVSNPEFLAEGSAMQDLQNPDRVIIGGPPEACHRVASLYLNWIPADKIIFTNIYSAELSKIVANSFLAQRISSINSVSMICEKLGANVEEVSKCIGSDTRIGNKFLKVSVGFGGSCLRKDLLCLIYLCESLQLDEAAMYWRQVHEMNEYQKNRFSNLIISTMFGNLKGKVISILGVTFKANTNDIRDSAALSVVDRLITEQAILRVYDPKGKLANYENTNLEELFIGCNAIVILTEWEEFKHLDYQLCFEQMEQPAYIFDGRNLLDPQRMRDMGFLYYSIGRV